MPGYPFRSKRYILPLLLLIITASCRSSGHISDDELPRQPFYAVDDSLQKDSEMEEWLEPYRAEYSQQMGRVVARTHGEFTFGQPESTLGNLVSDMIRYRASHEMRQYVHVALIDMDSFQLEFNEGLITLGELYEFMPFNSQLVVVEMKGDEVRKLADEIARKGGVPVSGLRMNILDDEAGSVLVNVESPDPGQTYLVATSSYIAGGGGGFSSIENSRVQHEHDLFIREIIIDYMRSRREFYPEYDQRIRTR